jgi:hypothetical protein
VSEANQLPGAGNPHAGILLQAQHKSVAGQTGNLLSYADVAICPPIQEKDNRALRKEKEK